MTDRYPAHYADQIFGEDARMERWADVTTAFAIQSAIQRDYAEAAKEIHEWYADARSLAHPTWNALSVRTAEYYTGHDVVAFLRQYALTMPDHLKPFVHYGLTSSDIVDNAHFTALSNHTRQMADLVQDLYNATFPQALDPDLQSVAPGRTHGQVAELTSWRWRFKVWRSVLREIQEDLISLVPGIAVVKSPGPTGQSVVAAKVAMLDRRVVPSTQVIPRDYQLRWAALYLRLGTHLENLAVLVRAGSRSDVGEVMEGAAVSRTGSSAMAHKKNPIAAERLCGLARVVRGHFLAIAESTVLWEDRDISNSSVERTSVPDLAGLVEYMTTQATSLLNNLQFFPDRMQDNVDGRCFANLLQALVQKHALLGPEEAQSLVKDAIAGSKPDDWPEKVMVAVRRAVMTHDAAEDFIHEYYQLEAKMMQEF